MARDKGFWINLKDGSAIEITDHERYLQSNPGRFGLTAQKLQAMKDRRERLVAAMKKGWLRMRKQRNYVAFEHAWRDRPDVFHNILTFLKKHKGLIWPNERLYISHVDAGVDFEGTAQQFIDKWTPKRGKGVPYDPRTAPPEDWGHETDIFNLIRRHIYRKKGIPFESAVPFEVEVDVIHEALGTMGVQNGIFNLNHLLRDLGFKYDEDEGPPKPPEPEYGTISEAGLSRLWAKTKEPFVILTAFRDDPSRGDSPAERLRANRQLNRKLLAFLNANKMGAYKLVGHWLEGPQGMDYETAVAKGLAHDVVEEPFFVPKPRNMSKDEFLTIMKDIAFSPELHQDSILYGDGKTFWYWYRDNPRPKKAGDKITFSKVAQAYSQLRKRPGVPFVFEGVIMPINVMSRQALSALGLLWPVVS